MHENDTDCQAENETPSTTPTLRPVRDWAERKRVEHWLLCLAATHAKWLPEQVDDAVDEVTEAEFDAAVKAARDTLESLKHEHGKQWIRTLVHGSLLVGVIIQKMKPTERNVVQETIGNAPDDKTGGEMARGHFHSRIKWPSKAAYTQAIESVSGADLVLTLKWLQSLGQEAGEPAKKR